MTRALVLASSSTVAVVANCVDEVHVVSSVKEALRALEQGYDKSRKSYFELVVAALGSTPDTFLIHSKGETVSPLFKYAQSIGNMPRIVYSNTACRSDKVQDMCFAAGADAVVSSQDGLEKALRVLFTCTSRYKIDETCVSRQDKTEYTVCGPCPSMLERRRQRREDLVSLAHGRKTWRVYAVHRWVSVLEKQMAALSATSSATTNGAQCTTSSIRLVHMSDTHKRHREFGALPTGDRFVHTGDFCANYDPALDLLAHLHDFLDWLQTAVCPNFDKVILIPGNHDTFMDPVLYPQEHAKAMPILQAFLRANPNVMYLYNTSVRYQGLLITASSMMPSRLETKKKRYLSNGGERTQADRQHSWSQGIPEDTDILLTHVPPIGKDGCPVLWDAVFGSQRSKRPAVHAFGHVHDDFGIHQVPGYVTLMLNGCQDYLLHEDMEGVPLIVNVPLPFKTTGRPIQFCI